MSGLEQASGETLPFDDFYKLSEEQRAKLPEEAQVALAIAGIRTEQESFKETSQITRALIEATGLEPTKVRDMNRRLIQDDYIERVNAAQPDKVLQLWLSEKGYKFLDEEVRKVSS